MTALSGKRVLVVEDEAILAMAIEDMLGQLGCIVIGPALTISESRQLAEHEALDAAVLDINMGGGSSFAVAEGLRARSVPFCFSTGYGRAGVPATFREVPVLQKPYQKEAFAAVLIELLS